MIIGVFDSDFASVLLKKASVNISLTFLKNRW